MKLDPTKAAALERLFIEVAQQVRETLGDQNVGSFTLTAKAEGRCGSGDMKVEFFVSDSEYSSGSVKSFSIQPALEETLRRNGWEKVNQPLCLPRSSDEPQTDGDTEEEAA